MFTLFSHVTVHPYDSLLHVASLNCCTINLMPHQLAARYSTIRNILEASRKACPKYTIILHISSIKHLFLLNRSVHNPVQDLFLTYDIEDQNRDE